MTASVESSKQVLNRLVTSLQCAICRNHPPTNVHICPRCSELFCFRCIQDFIRRNRNRCAKCNGTLHANTLIKLRCLDVGGTTDQVDELGADLACLNLGAESSDGIPEVVPPPVECHQSETRQLEVGRAEPVPGVPRAVEGTFTLRNVHGCRLAWVCSEHLVDELGFKWRLRIKVGSGRDCVLGAFVELLYGEEGFYELLLELQNVVPVAFLVRDRIGHDAYVGVPSFLNKRTLPAGRLDLRFRYTIRPADFKAKVQIQQRLLNQRTSRTQRLKGNGDCFVYQIDNYSVTDLDDAQYELYTDQFGSVWKVGIHGNHEFVDFEVVLVSGLPGIFQLEAELTHPDGGCEKHIAFERNVQLNQRNFFNFHIRWNQLAEYGYDHGHQDVVEVRFIVIPLQVDLKQVVNVTRSNDGEGSDGDGGSEEDYYNYSSSSYD
uniref:Putative ring finger n=1 Tax=Culex tarsalis TaxID=7177 RepID=A0A1Q3FE97_CULTA